MFYRLLSPRFCLHGPCFSRRNLSCPGLSTLAFRSQSPSFPVSAPPLYFRLQSFPSSTIPVLSHFPCPRLFPASCFLSPVFPSRGCFPLYLSLFRTSLPLRSAPILSLSRTLLISVRPCFPAYPHPISVSAFPCSRLCPLLAFSHFASLPPIHRFSRSSSPVPPSPRPAPPGGGNTDFPRLTKQELKNIVEKLSKIVVCKVFLVTFVKSRVAGRRGDEV